MTSSEIILEIIAYAKKQGVDFETALRMFQMMYDNKAYLDEPFDSVIDKEFQTHLDATHIGGTGNSTLYYKSETLKNWFWWNEACGWEDCAFGYDEDTSDLYSISISKSV